MKRLVIDATKSPRNGQQWLVKLICEHETLVTSKYRPRTVFCPHCLQREIDNGTKGQCVECNRTVGLRVPRAKFHPGDGTYRVTFKHQRPNGEPCKGSGWAAKGWGFVK